mmetsp:Transcript_20753/g.65279  ORF Transcript_20753/g.65279 Transcript_20753/m.65279 type:complete len:243 (+) Transcript_20753:663-1391(+)
MPASSERDAHARVVPQDRVALVELVRRRDGRADRHREVGALSRCGRREFDAVGRLLDHAREQRDHVRRKLGVVLADHLNGEVAGVLDEFLENFRAVVLALEARDRVVVAVVEDVSLRRGSSSSRRVEAVGGRDEQESGGYAAAAHRTRARADGGNSARVDGGNAAASALCASTLSGCTSAHRAGGCLLPAPPRVLRPSLTTASVRAPRSRFELAARVPKRCRPPAVSAHSAAAPHRFARPRR